MRNTHNIEIGQVVKVITVDLDNQKYIDQEGIVESIGSCLEPMATVRMPDEKTCCQYAGRFKQVGGTNGLYTGIKFVISDKAEEHEVGKLTDGWYEIINPQPFPLRTMYQSEGSVQENLNSGLWHIVSGNTGEVIDYTALEDHIAKKGEESGGTCDYYNVEIMNPTTPEANRGPKYTAECNDIIEELDMTFAEANMFKEIWRTAAARTLGKHKANHSTKRGAEKIMFFAKRNAVKYGVSND